MSEPRYIPDWVNRPIEMDFDEYGDYEVDDEIDEVLLEKALRLKKTSPRERSADAS